VSDLRRHGQDEEDLERMGLLEHLEELRDRILYSLIAFFIAFVACWTFAKPIYNFLSKPIYLFLKEGEKLAYTSVTEPFMLYIKVAALAAVFIASPFILYQVWSFVAPGLYKTENRMVGPFIFFGSMLFLAGGAFAYYIAFPFAVQFLLGMGEDFEAVITVNNYLSFLMTIVLGLGVMFELPTVIFLLSRFGLVTPRFLMRNFRWAVVIIFTVAAVITPTPDVVNLCVFALPTIVLYLVGVAVAAIFKPDRELAQEPAADEAA